MRASASTHARPTCTPHTIRQTIRHARAAADDDDGGDDGDDDDDGEDDDDDDDDDKQVR